MTRVLFVCLGNICRSPMAEALFRNHAQKKKYQDFFVDSAATSRFQIGNPPYHGTKKILDQFNIDYSGMAARQITADDFKNFDYIICMDQKNEVSLQDLADKKYHHKIKRYLAIDSNNQLTDVPDPYYTGDFEETYQLLNGHLMQWFDFFKKEANRP